MTNNVFWLLELSVKDGQLEAFQALMEEMVASTQEEPGALNYEWWLTEDQSQCHIYERYQDSTATMVHMGNFGQKFAERFMACVDIMRFQVYGNANEEVMAALGPVGAVKHRYLGGFVR